VYLDGMMIVRGTLVPADFIEWHPNPGIRIGPNVLLNADFEEWHAGTANAEPDCWTDFELLTDAATGTNNREAINVLQGCYALRVNASILSLNNYKGVYQDIRARVVNDTEYVLIAWVNNAAMGPNCSVRVYVQNALPTTYALNSGDANSVYTRYAVTFTPTAADANIYIILVIWGDIAGGSGIAYFDKLMVIEASVYNGHSFAPEEWTGCGYPYNHYDQHCGHVNYLDAADLRGDVDAPIKARVVHTSDGGANYEAFSMKIARRTRYPGPGSLPGWPLGSFNGVFEAEDALLQTNWADAVDADQSGGNIVSDNAAASGELRFAYGGAGGKDLGAFRFWARVWANDIVNTQFRLGVKPGGQVNYNYLGWEKARVASKWVMLDMGRFPSAEIFAESGEFLIYYISLIYQKDAAGDIAKCDYVLMLPDDEEICEVEQPTYIDGLVQGDYWRIDETKDFPSITKVFIGTLTTMVGVTCHGPMVRLHPGIDNRLLFNWDDSEHPAHTDRVNIVSTGGAHADCKYFRVELFYLPQYISPLE